MSKIPELKGGQMLTIAYFIGILIVLFIVYKILGGLGLIKTAAAKSKDAAVENVRTSDLFLPEYWKGKGGKQLGEQAGKLHASELRAAMAGFGTDEEAIFATFGKLYNKINVSELTGWYNYGFDRDLQTDLLNELSEKDVATLWSIIEKLPNK